MTTLKTQLIDLITHLKPAPQHAVTHLRLLGKLHHALSDPSIHLPETEKSKNEIAYFVTELFTQEPSLMNPSNKKLLEQFQHDLESKPTPSPNRQK